MNKILTFIGVAFTTLITILFVNTIRFTAETSITPNAAKIEIDFERITANMSKAITYKTISFEPGTESDTAPFTDFIDFLQKTYPRLHEETERILIANYTPLFAWRGKDSSLQTVLLTAHYDVVPVIPGTEDKWARPPFAGEQIDGYIYGRGALDNKIAVITLMEAAEKLASEGFSPNRTIYISLGHDEEIGGNAGAAGVTQHLKDQGVRLAWSLDEGSSLIDGILPVDKPVGMINVAEKGWVSMDVIASGVGGHSSMPPPKTAVGKLAEAIVKIQESPLPGGLSGITHEMLNSLGSHFPWYQKIFIANQWLFGGLIERVFAANPSMNAMMRTTSAPTMLSASLKENVLPIEATARGIFASTHATHPTLSYNT